MSVLGLLPKSSPIKITLSGIDQNLVMKTGEELRSVIQRVPGADNVKLSVEKGNPEYVVNPDKDKIYFLRRLPQDPLVSPRQGVNGNWGIRSYASSADDPKEGADVYDIYSTATGVGLNGNKYSQW